MYVIFKSNKHTGTHTKWLNRKPTKKKSHCNKRIECECCAIKIIACRLNYVEVFLCSCFFLSVVFISHFKCMDGAIF